MKVAQHDTLVANVTELESKLAIAHREKQALEKQKQSLHVGLP